MKNLTNVATGSSLVTCGNVLAASGIADCGVGSVDINRALADVCFTENFAYITSQTGGRLKINGSEYLDENGRIKQRANDNGFVIVNDGEAKYSLVQSQFTQLYRKIKQNFTGHSYNEWLVQLEYDEIMAGVARAESDFDEYIYELQQCFELKYLRIIEPTFEGGLRLQVLIRIDCNDDFEDALYENLVHLWDKGEVTIAENFAPLDFFREINPFLNPAKRCLLEQYDTICFDISECSETQCRPHTLTMPHYEAVSFLKTTGYRSSGQKIAEMLFEKLDENTNSLVSSQFVEYFTNY